MEKCQVYVCSGKQDFGTLFRNWWPGPNAGLLWTDFGLTACMLGLGISALLVLAGMQFCDWLRMRRLVTEEGNRRRGRPQRRRQAPRWSLLQDDVQEGVEQAQEASAHP